MTEIEMLTACLEQRDRITGESAEAFENWLDQLERRVFGRLSEPRRKWLDGVCASLGIETGAVNLVSTGKVKPTPAERASLKAFHESLGPKALKPPNRRK